MYQDFDSAQDTSAEYFTAIVLVLLAVAIVVVSRSNINHEKSNHRNRTPVIGNFYRTPVRTFRVKFGGHLEAEAVLLDCYTHFVLALAHAPTPVYAAVCTVQTRPIITDLTEAPFVAETGPNGRVRFSMKTTSENQGLLKQLTRQQVLRKLPGRRVKTIVEVLLDKSEISHTCIKCAREGLVKDRYELACSRRLLACSGCDSVYYCDAKCQAADKNIHAEECRQKLWLYRRGEAACGMHLMQKVVIDIFVVGIMAGVVE